MPDKLTDRARKAAEEVIDNMSRRPTYTWVDDTTEILERYMREAMTAAYVYGIRKRKMEDAPCPKN